MIYEAAREEDTARLAARVAAALTPPCVLCLHGNLGAGKTSFSRALIRALSGDDALVVPSPTFTLLQTYDTPRGPVWHFDLYRLENPDDVFELGWEDALAAGIVIVEWPERLNALKAPSFHDILIEGAGIAARRITIPDGLSVS